MGHPLIVFVLGLGAEGGELAALCIIGLCRPLPTGKIMTACSVTLSLIFLRCADPALQRKRDPPRSFALLNYCEKRANNAATRPIAPDLLTFFFNVTAIINSVISVALFAGAI